MSSATVRNLEQIQEQEGTGRPSRLGALLLSSLATAAIVTAGLVVANRTGPAAVSDADPLAELVQSESRQQPAEELEGREVTFPGVLSDEADPTTALAAVRDERGRLVAAEEGEASVPPPPPAGESLPLSPLPVGTLLSATPVTSTPKDQLTQLAADATRVPDDTQLAPAGTDGGFQLQVASFKAQPDADKLVEDLRQRGHRAYRQAAYVPGRGLWHRVRIGPFKSRLQASRYQAEFEKTERLSPFVVDPEKVKRAEEQRAARLAKREGRDTTGSASD